jgi:indole-3-acetate monooxygenase
LQIRDLCFTFLATRLAGDKEDSEMSQPQDRLNDNASRASVDPVAAATQLTPLIRAYADETESNRRLAAPVVQALRSAGLLAMGLSAALGGPETPLATALRAIEQISYADGATGWNAMIAFDGGLVCGFLEAEAARALVASISQPIIVGSINPPGRLQRTPGGYRLSGQWRFGSGCQQADVFNVAALLYEGEHPVVGISGMPDLHQITLRAKEVEIVDTWHVTGLRGTGSHDIAARDVAVGEGYVQPMNFEVPVERGPLYAFPLVGSLAVAKAAVALGIARHAIGAFKELAQAKTAAHQTNLLCERSAVQSDLARAEAGVRSASCFLAATVEEVWASVLAGIPATIEQRGWLRLAAVDGVQRAVKAVDLMYNAAGTNAIFQSSPLERCFRDIHVVPAHIVVQPSVYEVAGRVFLNLPPGTPLF